MRVRARVVLTAVAALATVVSMAAPAAAAGWHFETLDGSSTSGGRVNANVGEFTATAVLDGNPHTFYRDRQSGTLRHGWYTGSKWLFETLDGASNGPNGRVNRDVGTDVKVAVFGGRPHVFYYDVANGDLRHAWWTGAIWSFETLDGNANNGAGRVNQDVGTDLSIANLGGNPHLFYYGVTAKTLRHAWWTGLAWGYETLDGSGTSGGGRVSGDVGQYTSTVVSAGLPHVFYYDDTNTVLRHAWWTGQQWSFETLDGAGGPGGRVNESVGSDAATALLGGAIHIWYYDVDKDNLRHAWWTGLAWGFETLDGSTNGPNGKVNADVGTYGSVVGFGGLPHVFYRNEQGATLRHGWWTGSTWAFETLDPANTGLDTSAVISGSAPHLFYYDVAGGNLKHAWYG